MVALEMKKYLLEMIIEKLKNNKLL